MATGIEPITLPWKRPEKGVSAAELGASFRVEQREDGWHCTVRVGRRAEVLATGMRRLRDAQCRAEAHAATLPEVAAALAQAEAAKAAAKTPGRVGVVVENKTRIMAPTFEQVSDGCICGKIENGTWIADPAGKVSVPAGTDPAMAQEICRVAAKHYAAQREDEAAAKSAKAAAKTAARAAAKTAKAAAKVAAKSTKTAAKTVTEATARAKTTAKATAKTAKATAKTVAAAEPAADKAKRGRSKAANKKAAKKATQRRGPKYTPQPFSGTNAPPGPSPEALRILAAEAAASEQAAGRGTAKGPRGRRGKGKQAKATAATAKEEPMGKRSGKAKGEACGCVTWTEAEGKARGEAKHGAFVVEPEGKRHALYFYDPDGQSRHLQSGEASKLRKVAEEMAARGQPAPRTAASATDDAALMRAFMGGAMEDEA
jgi:hypothetical protein